MKIHHTTTLGVCDTYEVVTEPPLGYIIWNIGDNAPEGYLPFCRLKFMQPFEGGREIESDTLKAIKCDGAREILAAIGLGAETSAEMKEFIKKHERNPRRSWECERMRAAIPYLEKIGM
jgi:hypothetical protein